MVKHFTQDKKDKYADVSHVRIDDLDVAIKYCSPTQSQSKESAMTELAVDDASLRANLPGMVPYVGRILNSDGHILAVITKIDFSPGLADVIKDKSMSRSEAKKKLTALIDGFAERGYYLADNNPENIRVRPDGSLFIFDGAAVSRKDRYGQLPGEDLIQLLPIDVSISTLSPYEGLYESFAEMSFESDRDYEEPYAADEPDPPRYLNSSEVAKLVLDYIARVHSAEQAV